VRKALGLLGLLVVFLAVESVWEYYDHGRIAFLTQNNLGNLFNRIGLFGILSLAQAFVIISGGIDLSVGSVIALVSTIAAILLAEKGVHPALVLPGCLALAALIGAWHGLLVTKVRMQPFVVTLCGLFLYRGVARYIAGDTTHGFGTGFKTLKWLGQGRIAGVVPVPLVVLLLLAVLVGAHLHFTARGRHLFALGANERSARFSGIPTDRIKIQAYVLCSLLSGLGGLLIAFKVNSLGPSDFGSFYELYAIAGAVLGGCSLRGGSGNVVAVIVGASAIMVLRNLVIILKIPSELEYVVIGSAILVGVFVDELVTRRAARRAAVRRACPHPQRG